MEKNDLSAKHVGINKNTMKVSMLFDLNTRYLYEEMVKKFERRREDGSRTRLFLPHLLMTIMYNLISGVWQLTLLPDNYKRFKNPFTRSPEDSFRQCYVSIQPAYINQLAAILDALEDAVAAEDKENAMRLAQGAKALMAENLEIPHPKIKEFLKTCPDYTKYFTLKGSYPAARLKAQYMPGDVKDIFKNYLVFTDPKTKK